MLIVQFDHDGSAYEIHRLPPSASPDSPRLSVLQVDALILELWRAGKYAQLERLGSMFAWNNPTLAFDIAAIDRLREQCRTAIDLWVLSQPLSRPVLTSADAPVDLTDLIGDNVPPVPVPPRPPSHFFECLIKDQDSVPIVGLRCLVESPHADPVVVPTDQHGLIRYDDLPGPGDYQITPLRGAGQKGGRRDPVPAPGEDWFECTLVGSQGEALPDRACELITPDGVAHPCHSDDQGMIRLEGLGITGDCELRFLEAV